VYEAKRASVLGVQIVPKNDTDKYGIVAVEADKSATSRVNSIVEKPKPSEAPSNLAVVGRYVLSPAIFEHLEKVGRGAGGEIQLTDGIAALMKEEAVYAHRFNGKRYDCGSKLGYLQANVEFALGHPQLGKDFGKYLQTLSRETIASIAAQGNDYVRVDRRKGNGSANGHDEEDGKPEAPAAAPRSGGKTAGRRKGKGSRSRATA
jgi:UTP--glucose-1-phosphate uridylyltransferase